jgi:hypothetical protein
LKSGHPSLEVIGGVSAGEVRVQTAGGEVIKLANAFNMEGILQRKKETEPDRKADI